VELAMSANHGAICTRNNCSSGNSSLIGESRAEGVSFSSLERWPATGFSTPFSVLDLYVKLLKKKYPSN
ncbi:hypothetical protein PIB30_106668, partial [Stylosanthes scabra]|nr:hypothetical protein [Stylosanthes scabra]